MSKMSILAIEIRARFVRAMQAAAMRTAMEEALRRFYRAVLHLAMKAPIEDDAPLRRVLLKLQTLPPAPSQQKKYVTQQKR